MYNRKSNFLFPSNLDIDWAHLARGDGITIENFKLTIDWTHLCKDENAHLLDNFGTQDWSLLSCNIHAIPILEKNLYEIDWCNLSLNKNAIHILEKNQHKISWSRFHCNPNIFVCDYDYYKKRLDVYREELIKKVFHPQRLCRYLEKGYDLDFEIN